jgi:hypothetical protein
MSIRTTLRTARGALGIALTWAIVWALAGVAIGVASLLLPWLPWERVFAVFDAPLPALGVPGVVGGLCYALVLRVAGRTRAFAELTVPQIARWGALGGLLLSVVPATLVTLGLATARDGASGLLASTLVLVGPFVALGAGSAALTFRLAQRATGEARVSPPAAPAAPALPR